MKHKIISLVLAVALTLTTGVGVAVAARPTNPGGGGGSGGHGDGSGGGGNSQTNTLGYDISYPQCDTTLPTDQAFGVVGVNGYNANEHNPCLQQQFAWALLSTGAVAAQEKAQLYVNTANPGQVINQINTWPTDNSNSGQASNPYGTCTGDNDAACSYEYGWSRAVFSLDWFTSNTHAVAGDYKWWLDVETGNTWQTGTTQAYKNNVADLEGEVAAFAAKGVTKVGLYSTAYQWGQITNNELGFGTLNGLDNWRPGGANIKTAQQACTADPLTPNGSVVMTQFESKGLDNDFTCSLL